MLTRSAAHLSFESRPWLESYSTILVAQAGFLKYYKKEIETQDLFQMTSVCSTTTQTLGQFLVVKNASVKTKFLNARVSSESLLVISQLSLKVLLIYSFIKPRFK